MRRCSSAWQSKSLVQRYFGAYLAVNQWVISSSLISGAFCSTLSPSVPHYLKCKWNNDSVIFMMKSVFISLPVLVTFLARLEFSQKYDGITQLSCQGIESFKCELERSYCMEHFRSPMRYYTSFSNGSVHNNDRHSENIQRVQR